VFPNTDLVIKLGSKIKMLKNLTNHVTFQQKKKHYALEQTYL